MSWNPAPAPPFVGLFQRMHVLLLRLERLSAVKQAQKTQALIKALSVPPGKMP